MREEKRRRARDEDCSAAKKKRDESPIVHYSASSVASSSKSRGHIPVSERQQFALLKLMETKNLSSERAAKQTWDGQARETSEQDKSRSSVSISSSAMSKQQSGGNASLSQSGTGGSTPSRYSSPHQQQEASYPMERASNSHSHSHGHHGHGHSSSSSSSHHSGVSRRAAQVQQQSAPLLTQQRRGTTVTSPESSLMRAAKKGDILTLKMLVKEGSGVNDQDSNGRTPLHESSSQNYIHLVSYLLKHNANPNVRAVPRGGGGGGSGDTPLHEAAREGHARIVRALLRYGADHKICNNDGDRPIDVCTNESCQMVFKQINQSREFPSTTTSTGGSSFPLKKSAEPKSSPSPSSEGHLQSRSSFEEQGGGGPKRRGSPDLAGSSPTQSFRTSSSPHSHQHHHRHHSPSAVRRNTVSVPAPSVDPSGNIHQLPRLTTKKDPYAFDDEEVEVALQPNQEVTTPNTVPSTSSSPLHSHRFSSSGRFLSGTGGTLHVNTATSGESGLHSGPSSAVSPSAVVGGGAVGSGGPPLKLRFAMEAGHYTLMENQDNTSEQGAVASSSVGDIGGSGVSGIQSNPATPKVPEEIATLSKPEESSQSTISIDCAFKTEFGSEQKAAAATGSEEGGSDDGRLPKVPPLRIKLGGNTPPPSMTQPLQSSEIVETSLNEHDKKPEEEDEGVFSINLSGQSSKLEISSTETGEVNEDAEGAAATGGEPTKVESGDQEDEEKKFGESTSASASHPPKRGLGSGTGKASKVASATESTSGKRHAASAASESGDNKSKDSSDVKAEETIKTRSFRTLRSHTAAQREKEEREKNSDVTPPKKRKYRSRGGGGGNSGAEGFGGDGDTGKSTDHEDAGGANEASSMRSSSTNGDGGASTAAGGGDDDAQSPGEGASPYGHENKSGRVFDDPNKPSPLGWGENPYEKAAELNRGLSELIGKLVELQPKEPTGYQDYLLVTRDYLLAGHIPQLLSRRPCPPELPPSLMELFDEQEDERYAQALKHQSEREQLRLCAEQSVLRAQTRATIALANQPRPLSFCSVMALKGFTYLPPFKDPEHRDEESVRDRFKARTLIGWLQDIKDNFHMEKKKLLCRQLHEAESLMMVQKLDWEVKLKELHLHDYRASIFDQIPTQHVPLIAVPSDFPLFVHDPIQRPS